MDDGKQFSAWLLKKSNYGLAHALGIPLINRRYVTIDFQHRILYYGHSPTSRRVSVPIPFSSLIAVTETGMPRRWTLLDPLMRTISFLETEFPIIVKTEQRLMELYAESAEVRSKWIDALNLAIEGGKLDDAPVPASPSRSVVQIREEATPKSNVNVSIPTPQTSPKVLRETVEHTMPIEGGVYGAADLGFDDDRGSGSHSSRSRNSDEERGARVDPMEGRSTVDRMRNLAFSDTASSSIGEINDGASLSMSSPKTGGQLSQRKDDEPVMDSSFTSMRSPQVNVKAMGPDLDLANVNNAVAATDVASPSRELNVKDMGPDFDLANVNNAAGVAGASCEFNVKDMGPDADLINNNEEVVVSMKSLGPDADLLNNNDAEEPINLKSLGSDADLLNNNEEVVVSMKSLGSDADLVNNNDAEEPINLKSTNIDADLDANEAEIKQPMGDADPSNAAESNMKSAGSDADPENDAAIEGTDESTADVANVGKANDIASWMKALAHTAEPEEGQEDDICDLLLSDVLASDAPSANSALHDTAASQDTAVIPDTAVVDAPVEAVEAPRLGDVTEVTVTSPVSKVPREDADERVVEAEKVLPTSEREAEEVAHASNSEAEKAVLASDTPVQQVLVSGQEAVVLANPTEVTLAGDVDFGQNLSVCDMNLSVSSPGKNLVEASECEVFVVDESDGSASIVDVVGAPRTPSETSVIDVQVYGAGDIPSDTVAAHEDAEGSGEGTAVSGSTKVIAVGERDGEDACKDVVVGDGLRGGRIGNTIDLFSATGSEVSPTSDTRRDMDIDEAKKGIAITLFSNRGSEESLKEGVEIDGRIDSASSKGSVASLKEVRMEGARDVWDIGDGRIDSASSKGSVGSPKEVKMEGARNVWDTADGRIDSVSSKGSVASLKEGKMEGARDGGDRDDGRIDSASSKGSMPSLKEVKMEGAHCVWEREVGRIYSASSKGSATSPKEGRMEGARDVGDRDDGRLGRELDSARCNTSNIGGTVPTLDEDNSAETAKIGVSPSAVDSSTERVEDMWRALVADTEEPMEAKPDDSSAWTDLSSEIVEEPTNAVPDHAKPDLGGKSGANDRWELSLNLESALCAEPEKNLTAEPTVSAELEDSAGKSREEPLSVEAEDSVREENLTAEPSSAALEDSALDKKLTHTPTAWNAGGIDSSWGFGAARSFPDEHATEDTNNQKLPTTERTDASFAPMDETLLVEDLLGDAEAVRRESDFGSSDYSDEDWAYGGMGDDPGLEDTYVVGAGSPVRRRRRRSSVSSMVAIRPSSPPAEVDEAFPEISTLPASFPLVAETRNESAPEIPASSPLCAEQRIAGVSASSSFSPTLAETGNEPASHTALPSSPTLAETRNEAAPDSPTPATSSPTFAPTRNERTPAMSSTPASVSPTLAGQCAVPASSSRALSPLSHTRSAHSAATGATGREQTSTDALYADVFRALSRSVEPKKDIAPSADENAFRHDLFLAPRAKKTAHPDDVLAPSADENTEVPRSAGTKLDTIGTSETNLTSGSGWTDRGTGHDERSVFTQYQALMRDAEEKSPDRVDESGAAQVVHIDLFAAELSDDDVHSPDIDHSTGNIRLEDYLQENVPDAGISDFMKLPPPPNVSATYP